ncbi:roadblock/LC7 domain-containing protein [Streptomyces sp. NBC_01451]|uniref:roadblock/LC7 domain-containing protein n=1 Tax=Streptomyces sp. NBC_01451 TaxID=2903872 RepID=UPI002E2F10D4|nr:roadblock/LC7 domain-containing protein [Streptomyces sp. NBC_01451]
MTYDMTGAVAPAASPDAVKGQMTRLLDDFVAGTVGVSHALLGSRDGLKQVFSSHMDPDWADELAATFSGMSGLAKGVTGPTGKQVPAQQILLEREDVMFLVTNAGVGSTFHQSGKTVATVLVVLVATDANIGAVAFEIGRLVSRFAPFMTTLVRDRDADGEAAS